MARPDHRHGSGSSRCRRRGWRRDPVDPRRRQHHPTNPVQGLHLGEGTWRALPSFQQCGAKETLVELALYEDVSQLHTDLLGEEGGRESAVAGLQALIDELGEGGDLSGLQTQLTALSTTLNALSLAVASGDGDLQDQIDALMLALANGDAGLAAQISALQSQLNAQSQATTDALATLQANVAGVETSLTGAITAGDQALQAQIQALQAQVNALTAQNQDRASSSLPCRSN